MKNPIKKTGHIQILCGNVAPEGSVAKITGKEGLFFSGIIFFDQCYNPYNPLFPGLVYFDSFQKLKSTAFSPGPALVFEGEETMIAAISEDPMRFKVSLLTFKFIS